jgi:hypothetical protein
MLFRVLGLLGSPLFAAVAMAQEREQPGLPAETAIPLLMFFTLGAALLIGIGVLAWYLRKRSNRDAMRRALDLDDRGPR